MASHNVGRRQVDLFNFSFLDILACVIGLLIFVLTIVVVSSGGGASESMSPRLADSEHDLRDARAAEQLAADRRRRAQARLNQRSDEVIGPVAAASALQNDIDQLRQQRDLFQSFAERAHQRLASILEASTVSAQATATDPKIGQLERNILRLDAEAERMRQKAAALVQASVKTADVAYHVPRLHETSRRPYFIEIAGDRIWALSSGDYEQEAMNEDSVIYRLRPSAQGVPAADFAHSLSRANDLIRALPQATVLSVAVRPNGFAAFRTFRDWAWKKGYAVNWLPMENGEPIVISKTDRVLEQ